MTNKSKIVIGVLTVLVFLGVGYYDADRRAVSMQHRASAYYGLCQDRAATLGQSDEQCVRDLRRADEESHGGKVLLSALPIAAGAAAIFLVLALVLMRFRRRRPAEQAAG